jgi:protein ImuB
MRRIVCLWVRQLPLAAALRVEPDLRDRPVAISAGRGQRSPIVALSPVARARGVEPAMTAAQARAVCPTLTVRPASREALTAAGDALADVAETVSPRVELDDDGTVFLDATGCFALCASEPELATVLGARAERQGLPVSVGIASSKLVARIAAREGEGVRIVPAGAERAYLARLSLALLDPSATVTTTFAAWGMHTMGDVAVLPASEVAHRLGPEGARIARQARGADDEPLRARARPLSFLEAVELDYALDRLEPALFVLHRLVERLTARLALHGVACGALELQLRLADGTHDLRPIAIAAPTAETKVLLTLLRADLERRQPTAGVIGIVLSGLPTPLRTTQLDFFQPRGPAPAALAATIARLAVLCGPDRVGAPRCADSHRPDAADVVPFAAPPPAGERHPYGATVRVLSLLNI